MNFLFFVFDLFLLLLSMAESVLTGPTTVRRVFTRWIRRWRCWNRWIRWGRRRQSRCWIQLKEICFRPELMTVVTVTVDHCRLDRAEIASAKIFVDTRTQLKFRRPWFEVRGDRLVRFTFRLRSMKFRSRVVRNSIAFKLPVGFNSSITLAA